MITLRAYAPVDCPTLHDLFLRTVHTVNARDYSPAQLDAWTNGVDLTAWNASFLAHHTLVAEWDSVVVGFGDMDREGYFDRLYVHSDYQGRGVATALADALERHAATLGATHFTTHASITARPFFAGRGYRVVRKRTVVRDGVTMTNFGMEKDAVPSI